MTSQIQFENVRRDVTHFIPYPLRGKQGKKIKKIKKVEKMEILMLR
jgi:hypothetical protein